MTKSCFKSNYRPGFTMTFENGWTISVQWHTGAYCDRRSSEHEFDDFNDRPEGKSLPAASTTAEIAMWDKEGNWYKFGNDHVLGYQTSDRVAKWIEVVRNLKEDENAI